MAVLGSLYLTVLTVFVNGRKATFNLNILEQSSETRSENRSGRAGIPVLNSPHGLYGRKATLNLKVLERFTGTSFSPAHVRSSWHLRGAGFYGKGNDSGTMGGNWRSKEWCGRVRRADWLISPAVTRNLGTGCTLISRPDIYDFCGSWLGVR